MKLIAITTLALLVVAIQATPEDDLIDGTRTCTATLYKELIKNKPNENIIFSPITIQTLLALLASASTNDNDVVIQQIRTALSLPNGNQNRQAAFKYILEELNKADNDFKVFDATKMYFKTGYTVHNWYRDIAQNVYRAEIETVNFADKLGTSRNINQWVAKKTQNKITNFIDSFDIAPYTQNVLINTLYLSGKWVKPFEQKENVVQTFYSPHGAKQVTMMRNTKTYMYYEDNNAQYVKLDLVRDGGGAEMVFVLPKQKQGLSTLENNVQNLLQPHPFVGSMVQVTLPKFSFNSDLKLKPVLQNIGITHLFNLGATLHGLEYGGHYLIQITDVLQKAFIEVNEWGVTAAAANEVLITVDGSDDNTKIFTADHPFLYYITLDDAVIYAGRVMKV